MGKEEMAELLETMLNDAEVAGRVADGDFSDLSEGELTGAERALLSAAGTDLDDDVAGFSAGFLKLGDIKGESTTSGDANHDKWIDVLSIDWGETNADGRHNAVLTIQEGKKRIGLLLPAVQKARESSAAPRRVSERLRHKGRMSYRETDGERIVKTVVFKDAQFQRPRATGRALR